MSPLWRDEVGVYLAPHRLYLVRLKRGTRPQPLAEHEQRFEMSAEQPWRGPLEALAALLGQAPWGGACTRIVFGDHWARYAIVPWAAALRSAEERLAHGRQLLSSMYGDAVASWDICTSEAPPQAARVACAAPSELLAGLRAACVAHGNALLSLQPQLIAAYAAWRHCLPASNVWFVSIEDGSLAAAYLGPRGWDRVHGVRIGSDWIRELKRLQTFGRLVRSDAHSGEVYVDAPHAWRVVAAAAGTEAGLRWLEEPKEPMNTLQRLGRARRLAA